MAVTRRIARGYRAPGHQDDVEQVAYLALVRAAERFDPRRGHQFLAFAVPTIHGEIKHYLRDHSWDTHVPRRLQDRALRARRISDDLAAELGRSPTIDELGARLGTDRETTLEALDACAARDARSLDGPPQHDGNDQPAPGDTPGFYDERLARALDRTILRSALASLSEQERQAVGLRFIADLTQREIAGQIGVSQMQVSRLLRRALDRMRAVTSEGKPEDRQGVKPAADGSAHSPSRRMRRCAHGPQPGRSWRP